MVEVLHQLGFRWKWNLSCLEDDEAGDGVICAARYMSPEDITRLSPEIRGASFFDPQFFLPNSGKGSLRDYDFFPSVVADGFSTTEYSEEDAITSARKCVEFQLGHGFSRIVIPTRYREATPTDFLAAQASMFVEPFLQAAKEAGADVPILLQLILNDAMLKDDRFRNSVLNWLTGLTDVDGVYLIPQLTNRQKQVADIDYLVSLMNFIRTVRTNEMDAVVGYLNTEALVVLAADPTAVTIGGYENLRMFSIRAFIDDENGPTRGPSARIYVAKLLQWINHQYIGAIRSFDSDFETLLDDSDYKVSMFEPSYNWHFTKPEPYKHYFSVFSRQIKRLSATPLPGRISAIREECERALVEHQRINDLGVVFDADSGPAHLGPWITALNLFERNGG